MAFPDWRASRAELFKLGLLGRKITSVEIALQGAGAFCMVTGSRSSMRYAHVEIDGAEHACERWRIAVAILFPDLAQEASIPLDAGHVFPLTVPEDSATLGTCRVRITRRCRKRVGC